MWRGAVAILGMLVLAACQAVPDARPVLVDSAEARRVSESLAQWPRVPGGEVLNLAIGLELRMGAGERRKGTAVLAYAGPRDLRLTALTKPGELWFDARFTWAGATVLRKAAGVDEQVIEGIMGDLSMALEPPPAIEGLAVGRNQAVLTRRPGDGRRRSWIFDAQSGRVEKLDVRLGLTETLRVTYERWSDAGWPGIVRMRRSAPRYEAVLDLEHGRAGTGTGG